MNVIIAGVGNQKNFDYYIEELKNLAIACDMNVCHTVVQRLSAPDNKYYFGSGKVNELSELVKEFEVDLIVVNNELTHVQKKTLEKISECSVLDRTQLILTIFEKRARTREAKLQVKIATLRYSKAFLREEYGDMDRQRGGGAVTRGSGETKTQVGKRRLDKQIKTYENELESIKQIRREQRKKRLESDIPIVAIVGYTNAGKSTLMNTLVSDEKSVFEKDMLFATLDTFVRQVSYNGIPFLLVDTIGFVSNLPHNLVESFKSTLEEVLEADLIIHLSDISSPFCNIQQEVVHDTLKLIGADEVNQLLVYNKIDLVDEEIDGELCISARTGQNVNDLLDVIAQNIFTDYSNISLKVPYSNSSIIDELKNITSVNILKQDESYIYFDCILNSKMKNKYNEYIHV